MKRREEILDFFFDLLGRGHGLGDFGAQQIAVTLAQPMDGHFEVPLGDVELAGGFGAGNSVVIAGQERF